MLVLLEILIIHIHIYMRIYGERVMFGKKKKIEIG